MSEKHDYASAIEALEIREDLGRDIEASPADILGSEHTETIRHALRFAEKMMQEPSTDMVEAGTGRWHTTAQQFKDMRDQAIKELGE